MARLPAPPTVVRGPDAGSGPGRAHLGRVAHAPDLPYPPLPFGGEQVDRAASLRGNHRGGKLLFRLPQDLDGSVWPASIAHSSHNVAWGTIAAFTVTRNPVVVNE